MNINWNFYNFNIYETYNGLNNIVYSYMCSITVSDGTISASHDFLVRLNFDYITNYIPFESLTKETVQIWTENSTDTQLIIKNLIESVVASNSKTKQNLPAPWSASNGATTS